MKVSKRNLGLAIIGETLVAFSLGAAYSIKLVIFGYFILAVSVLVIIGYTYTNFMSVRDGEKIRPSTNTKGLAATLLLVLFFGIQTPFFPYKNYMLMIGLVLNLPAVVNILEGLRK